MVSDCLGRAQLKLAGRLQGTHTIHSTLRLYTSSCCSQGAGWQAGLNTKTARSSSAEQAVSGVQQWAAFTTDGRGWQEGRLGVLTLDGMFLLVLGWTSGLLGVHLQGTELLHLPCAALGGDKLN